ncbi:hypothetical protein SRHO_G00223170 [Serrasalmus rhombeus]
MGRAGSFIAFVQQMAKNSMTRQRSGGGQWSFSQLCSSEYREDQSVSQQFHEGLAQASPEQNGELERVISMQELHIALQDFLSPLNMASSKTELSRPGDTILTPTPAPPGPWERQHRREPSRPSKPPQPIFTSCNRFAALSSPAYTFTYASSPITHPSTSALYTGLSARVLDIAKRLPSAFRRCNAWLSTLGPTTSDCRREVLKEHYQTLLPDVSRRQMPGSSPALFPPTGGDPSGSAGFSRCSPGSAAGAPSTA